MCSFYLELDGLALALLVAAQLEMLAALDADLHLVLARSALQPKRNFLGRLSLCYASVIVTATISQVAHQLPYRLRFSYHDNSMALHVGSNVPFICAPPNMCIMHNTCAAIVFRLAHGWPNACNTTLRQY